MQWRKLALERRKIKSFINELQKPYENKKFDKHAKYKKYRNCDYHSVIRESIEEFEGQFTCLGENI